MRYISKFKIALDIDGVLIDFFKALCDHLGIPVRMVKDWDLKTDPQIDQKLLKEVLFGPYVRADVCPGVIPTQIPFGFYCYITACPSKHKLERDSHFKELEFPANPIYYSSDKLSVMSDLNIDYLIDDRPLTVRKVRDAGKGVIQYMPYWASWEPEEGVPVAYGLHQIPHILKSLEKVK